MRKQIGFEKGTLGLFWTLATGYFAWSRRPRCEQNENLATKEYNYGRKYLTFYSSIGLPSYLWLRISICSVKHTAVTLNERKLSTGTVFTAKEYETYIARFAMNWLFKSKPYLNLWFSIHQNLFIKANFQGFSYQASIMIK